MPTWVKFAGLWSLAAVAALALSWVAVSQVRDRVIQPVTVIPTTIAALEQSSPDPTVVAVDPEVEEQADPTSSTSTTFRATTSTTRAPSAGSATSSTTAPSRTTTTAVTSTTAPPRTTTTVPSSSFETSSHSVPGGSVTISTSPGEVNFVSAVPQAGFTTELRDMGPERVRVRFLSSTLISEFEAEWEDGVLDIETSEHTP